MKKEKQSKRKVPPFQRENQRWEQLEQVIARLQRAWVSWMEKRTANFSLLQFQAALGLFALLTGGYSSYLIYVALLGQRPLSTPLARISAIQTEWMLEKKDEFLGALPVDSLGNSGMLVPVDSLIFVPKTIGASTGIPIHRGRRPSSPNGYPSPSKP